MVVDVYLVFLFSYIYEMNGLMDELKKIKEYVDRVLILLVRYYG